MFCIFFSMVAMISKFWLLLRLQKRFQVFLVSQFKILVVYVAIFLLGVSSKFIGTCVIEKDTERLDGVAFTASQKLFNFSFFPTKQVRISFLLFFFSLFYCCCYKKQMVIHRRIHFVSQCSITGAESLIKKMLKLRKNYIMQRISQRASPFIDTEHVHTLTQAFTDRMDGEGEKRGRIARENREGE